MSTQTDQSPFEFTYNRSTASVLAEVATERVRQDAKHGHPHLPLGFGPAVVIPHANLPAAQAAEEAKRATDAAAAVGAHTHRHIIDEEWREALAEDDPQRARAELIQLAATAVKAVEDIDRNLPPLSEGAAFLGLDQPSAVTSTGEDA